MRKLVLSLVVVALIAACSSSGDDGSNDGRQEPGTLDVIVAEAGGSVDPTDAEAVVEAFVEAGIPIGEVVVWDEDTDPNSLLGRPGAYIAKVSWTDDRIDRCDEGPGWECGGDVEVFVSSDDRDARFDHLGQFVSHPLGGFYMWRADRIILRVGYALTPSRAEEYATVLAELFGEVDAHPGRTGTASVDGELTPVCMAAIDEVFDSIRTLIGRIDDDISVLDEIGEEFGVELGELLGESCAIEIDTAVIEMVTTYRERLGDTSGLGLLFAESLFAELCTTVLDADTRSICPTPSDPTPTTTTQPDTTISTTTSTTSTSTTTTTTTLPERPGFRDGTRLVGDEIEPGRYLTRAGSGCYWERLSGLSGGFDDIITNSIGGGQRVVEILPTDEAFSSSGCGRWELYEPSPEPLDEFGDGDWIVGDQITPGRWRANGDDFCYWERASGFTHNFNEIIANSAGSQTIVDISPNDARFTSSGCGTWRPT